MKDKNQMKYITIKEMLEVKSETVVYTKAIITQIVEKISKEGMTFYILEITNGITKATVSLSPKYFEQEIKEYPPEPISDTQNDEEHCKINDNIDLIDFSINPCSMKVKCVQSKDMSSMNYFLCNIQKAEKIKFSYTTNDITEDSNIISTQEDIKNILTLENYKGFVDYKIALANVSLFEEITFQDSCAEITIYNIDEEVVDVYKMIFDFISDGGNLIYYTGGIVKTQTPQKKRELANKREILKDIRQIFYGCFTPAGNYNKECEICSLIFDERDRLNKRVI